MARITPEQAKKFQSAGNSTKGMWFNLKDGESTFIQFLNADNLEPYGVHKVEITANNKTFSISVDCLKQDADDDNNVCPFCESGIDVDPIVVMALYDHGSQSVKLWERSFFSKFIQKIEKFAKRYNPMEEYVFEIERTGTKFQTSYELFTSDKEPFDVSDIEIPDVYGTAINKKTKAEMLEYLKTGNFPMKKKTENVDADEEPVRRRRTAEKEDEPTPTPRRARRPEATRKAPEPVGPDDDEWLTTEESEDVPF